MIELTWIETIFVLQLFCCLLMIIWGVSNYKNNKKVSPTFMGETREEEKEKWLVIDKKLIEEERKNGLTQVKIARKYGIGKNSISEIKRGRRPPVRIRLN